MDKPIAKPLEEIKTLETLSQMQGQDLSSVTFDGYFWKKLKLCQNNYQQIK